MGAKHGKKSHKPPKNYYPNYNPNYSIIYPSFSIIYDLNNNPNDNLNYYPNNNPNYSISYNPNYYPNNNPNFSISYNPNYYPDNNTKYNPNNYQKVSFRCSYMVNDNDNNYVKMINNINNDVVNE